RWEVMDMTAMELSDASFDVVFDKGALDALMSDESEQVLEKARCMFSEVSRVLQPRGLYVCVSLCEDFIASTLLSHFHEHNYAVTVKIVVPEHASPFKPFFLVIGPKLLKVSLQQCCGDCSVADLFICTSAPLVLTAFAICGVEVR